jgi:glycosyltransferase involved in cell wall biosynthesis
VRLRIAIAKPDFGIRGGFELLVEQVQRRLVDDGHDVRLLAIPTELRDHRPYGIAIPDDEWAASPEYFTYLRLVEECARTDAHRADLLISTQPPTFHAVHDHHLALFSHHQRVFYDLADVAVRAGIVTAAHHDEATAAVRQIDTAALRAVGRVLATSETVRDRVRVYNGLDGTLGVFHAGPIGAVPDDDYVPSVGDDVLCVSRHEFPKRTELFVLAMKHMRHVKGVCIGAGGRLGLVQRLDQRLEQPGTERDVDVEELWINNPAWLAPLEQIDWDTNVALLGHVSDADLEHAYQNALCVVAPAYDEDYGLAAIEAMAYGKPLVVCRDGGHLTNFVEDGVNGFVVESDGASIAAAIERLRSDPAMALSMAHAAREAARPYTWDRAMDEIRDGIERVMS